MPRLDHFSWLAFLVKGRLVEVRIVPNMETLLTLPNETPVLVQWKGKWQNDFMVIQVEDVRRARA